jgi:DNA-binding NarL/FixJ family response regulator
MTDKLTLLEVDASTGIETIRDLTSVEIAEYEARQQAYAEAEQERQSKIAARESALAKLAALGLTEAEIAAL